MKFSQDGVPKEKERGNSRFCEIFEAGELSYRQRNLQRGWVSHAMVYRRLKEDKKHGKPEKKPGQPKLIDVRTHRLMARKIKQQEWNIHCIQWTKLLYTTLLLVCAEGLIWLWKIRAIKRNIDKRNTRKWWDATGTVLLTACYKSRWIFSTSILL